MSLWLNSKPKCHPKNKLKRKIPFQSKIFLLPTVEIPTLPTVGISTLPTLGMPTLQVDIPTLSTGSALNVTIVDISTLSVVNFPSLPTVGIPPSPTVNSPFTECWCSYFIDCHFVQYYRMFFFLRTISSLPAISSLPTVDIPLYRLSAFLLYRLLIHHLENSSLLTDCWHSYFTDYPHTDCWCSYFTDYPPYRLLTFLVYLLLVPILPNAVFPTLLTVRFFLYRLIPHYRLSTFLLYRRLVYSLPTNPP